MLLVNVRDQVETQGCRLSPWLFRGSVNKDVVDVLVNPTFVGSLTLREEDEFFCPLQSRRYAFPDMREGLKP
jgi:hypothetical protein